MSSVQLNGVMQSKKPLRCRLIACRESLPDDNTWSFYLINDSAETFERASLVEIMYEWGDWGNSENPNAVIADLAPGQSKLLWRDNGDGAELRMTWTLQVRMDGRDARLYFEFPKLYHFKELPVVEGLGKAGWTAAAEA